MGPVEHPLPSARPPLLLAWLDWPTAAGPPSIPPSWRFLLGREVHQESSRLLQLAQGRGGVEEVTPGARHRTDSGNTWAAPLPAVGQVSLSLFLHQETGDNEGTNL